jgi:hypothetical protein
MSIFMGEQMNKPKSRFEISYLLGRWYVERHEPYCPIYGKAVVEQLGNFDALVEAREFAQRYRRGAMLSGTPIFIDINSVGKYADIAS